jgi:hypothetical protein
VDTRDSWSRRRVVAKAEHTQDEGNPRFVVTSLNRAQWKARDLYEKIYCARGDMENRIKECQADLFADRTSTATMRANQLRPWFASMAYVLLCALRRIGLHHTDLAEATCGTIHLKLLKIGALVRGSVRRIKAAMPCRKEAGRLPLGATVCNRSAMDPAVSNSSHWSFIMVFHRRMPAVPRHRRIFASARAALSIRTFGRMIRFVEN